MTIREEYQKRFDNLLVPLCEEIANHLNDYLLPNDRIVSTEVRPKSVDSFVDKANKKNEDGTPKYTDPLKEIQDQIGARIVTFFKPDVEQIEEKVLEVYRPIELKEFVPDKETEFGYMGKHMVLFVPSDFDELGKTLTFFELQIKTLFQFAWSEANHDIGYKPSSVIKPIHKRKIAFTAAQAWGADQIFEEIFAELSTS